MKIDKIIGVMLIVGAIGVIGGVIIASFIYLLAQAEMIATVVPTFPVIDVAGFLGSTLWLLWIILIGIKFLKFSNNKAEN